MLLITLRFVLVFQKLALKSSIFVAKDHYLDKKKSGKGSHGILWNFQSTYMLQSIELTDLFSGAQLQLHV
jgi:hypothetical protein